MKKGFIDKWNNIEDCQNLLFFAQLVGEQIFDYSIPSNRMATLNSHYLCVDAISTIDDIEMHGVPEGTLKPIVSELMSSLKADIVFEDDEIKPIDFFVKQEGTRYRKILNVNDLNYQDQKKIVRAIYQKFFDGNQYLKTLKSKIKEIVLENDPQKQRSLFKLTKAFLTEVVNVGYSTQYIHEQLRDCFFNKKSSVESADHISLFLDIFQQEEKSYTIVLIADKDFRNITNFYSDLYEETDNITLRTELVKEQTYLHKEENERYFILDKIKSYDPYSAIEEVIDSIKVQLAFYKMNDHNYNISISKMKFCAYDESDYFSVYKHPKSSVKKARTRPIATREENIKKAIRAASSRLNNEYSEGQAILNAVTFHALSIDVDSKENQLLDLWAVFETMLDISNSHTSDRINQIISFLVPVLKQNYLKSLFLQLSEDTKRYSKEIYRKIISEGNDATELISFANIVLLDTYSTQREDVLSRIKDYPLLKERISLFNELFSRKKDIYIYVAEHMERISWQIMRIYRNRNLIIHNGRSMLYLPLIIENLHSYVDDFLDYMIDGFAEGKSKDIIFQELYLREFEWDAKMNVKNDKVDEETIKFIFS